MERQAALKVISAFKLISITVVASKAVLKGRLQDNVTLTNFHKSYYTVKNFDLLAVSQATAM